MGINQSDTIYAAVWAQTVKYISSEVLFFFLSLMQNLKKSAGSIVSLAPLCLWGHECLANGAKADGPVEVLLTVGGAAAAAAAC